MKKIFKTSLAVAVAAPLLLTSCLDETMPTSLVTQDQLDSSPKSGEATIWAMPAFMNNLGTLSTDYAFDWGYGSMMHIRDVMTEDMAIPSVGYNWFNSWAEVSVSLGEEYLICQYPWYYYWKLIQTTNLAVAAYKNPSTPTEEGYKAIAQAFRAFCYLDVAQMYEFLPAAGASGYSPITSAGNDVTHYTVPIVTDEITEAQARNNPRVHRDEMFKFIESDLNAAEANIDKVARMAKTLPDLACVYGLKARLYLWYACNNEKDGTTYFNLAAEYAQKAIDTSHCTPLTEAEWTDPKTGFNTLSSSSWMWGMSCQEEDNVVKSKLLNWTSWMSNEATFGYAVAGPYVQASTSFYKSVKDRDFRKLSWVAPDGSALAGREQYASGKKPSVFEEYFSIKFRPGGGDTSNYLTACSVGIPLMRVEEMWFILAEAQAQVNPSLGRQTLISFMNTYRGISGSQAGWYTCSASTKDAIIKEIILQKRIELWGEGLSFFDIKRLNYSVTRGYNGTNFDSSMQYNTSVAASEGSASTEARPAWMNFVIVRSEANNNSALVGWNNPSPYGAYENLDY